MFCSEFIYLCVCLLSVPLLTLYYLHSYNLQAKVTDTAQVKALPRCKKEIMQEKPAVLAKLLERDGCISIPKVLSHDTCDKLLAYVNTENERLQTLIKSKDSKEGGELSVM